MDNILLSLNYFFKIHIDDVTDDNELFFSIEGLEMIYNLKTHHQCGELNETFVTDYLKTEQIIIRRPITNHTTGFSKWCMETIEKNNFSPVSINIFILTNTKEICNHWIAEDAYPYGMRISPLSIDSKNPVIMEEIYINYKKLKRLK